MLRHPQVARASNGALPSKKKSASIACNCTAPERTVLVQVNDAGITECSTQDSRTSGYPGSRNSQGEQPQGVSRQSSKAQVISSMAHQVTRRIIDTHQSLRRFGVSHFLHITGLILYTLLGGLVFQALDYDAGLLAIEKHKYRCKKDFSLTWQNLTDKCQNRTFQDCENEIRSAMDQVDHCLRHCKSANCTKTPSLPIADLHNAVIFASTIYTTIGYGTIYPVTDLCKCAVIIYTVIGIPYFLATIAAIGRFLELVFMQIWDTCRLRSYGIKRKLFDRKRRRTRAEVTQDELLQMEKHQKLNFERRRLSPFIFGCMVTLGYLSFQAAVFKLMARKKLPNGGSKPQFSFLDSFYFVVQSVALVGFGDLFPENSHVIAWQFPFMFTGICFLSMCFFILQESVIENTARTSERISTGIDRLNRKLSRDIQPIKNRLRRSFSIKSGRLKAGVSLRNSRLTQARIRAKRQRMMRRDQRTRSRSYDASFSASFGEGELAEKDELSEIFPPMSEPIGISPDSGDSSESAEYVV